MATRRVRLGRNAKLYVGGAEVTKARNVTVTLEKELFDSTTKDCEGWKSEVGTLNSLTFEWDMLIDDTDSMLSTIRSAFLNDTPLVIGATESEGGGGIEADCIIASIGMPQQLTEGLTVNVTAKPTYSETPPRAL